MAELPKYLNFIKGIIAGCALVYAQPALSWCVLSPPPSAPYYRIITDINQGINEVISKTQTVTADQDLPQYCLSPENPGFLILGPDPYKHFEKNLTQDKVNIAVAVEDDGNPIIDHWFKYVISPKAMIQQVSIFEPQIKKIHIITNQKADVHLLKVATSSFQDKNIILDNHMVKQPKYTSQIVDKIIKKMDPNTEALWISPHHGQYGLAALLPSIIKQSLYGKKMTIGNSLPWIDKGVYMGVYPDNVGLGREVGQVALEHMSDAGMVKDSHNPEYHLIESLTLAANRKTLRFLDRKHSDAQLEMIKLWLPKN